MTHEQVNNKVKYTWKDVRNIAWCSNSIFRKSQVLYTLTSIMFSLDELLSEMCDGIAIIGVSVRTSSTNHTHPTI